MDEDFDNDIPIPLAMKIDGLIRLFDGDLTASEVLSMDIPSQRAMVKARLENLKRSQENYANGTIDAYSRRYANSMGFGGTDYSSPSLVQTSHENEQIENDSQPDVIDRSNSRNIKDLKYAR